MAGQALRDAPLPKGLPLASKKAPDKELFVE